MIKYAKKDNFYSIFPMGEIPNDWEELTKEEYDKHFEKTLSELKAEKLSELTSITSKFDNQLVNTDMIIKSSLGFSINADLRSQLNIRRLISIGAEPVSFIIADKTTVDLSLVQLNIIISECEENMQYLFDLEQSYKKQITDATTKEELDTIDLQFTMKDFGQEKTK